jgi:imidazolonepropionase-like amidohydrolase
MTPIQALVAATRHGAMATKSLSDYGTIESGKFADLLLLRADPTTDIHNIRQLELVMKDGAVADLQALPTKAIYSRSKP